MHYNKWFWLSSWSIAIPALLSSPATGFYSTFNGFTQCGVVDLEWWGAAYPPFSLAILPVDSNNPFKIMIPDNYDTWNATSRRGGYKLPPIPLSAGTLFLAAMDDKNGAGTGGISTVHTIGESSDVSCLPPPPTPWPPAEPTPKLITPAPPQQCEKFRISLNTSLSGILDYIYIRGWVPGGKVFSVPTPPPGSNTTEWTVNIPAGTQFMLSLATRGTEGQGGLLSTTPLFTVQGDDSQLQKTTCIKPSKSPSSTLHQPPATPSTSSATGPQELKQSPPTSVIAGSVVGGVAAIPLTSFLFWLYRRSKISKVEFNRLTALDAWPEPFILDCERSEAITPFT